jgi:hypothetical protein
MGAAATQDEIKRNAQPLLQPGEEIQAAVLAQTFNPLLTLLYQPVIFFGKPLRPIVVTKRRILVFRSGGLGMTKLSTVLAELPRNTPLGPASGRLWYRTTTLGQPTYIYPSFYGEVAAADAALGAPPREANVGDPERR